MYLMQQYPENEDSRPVPVWDVDREDDEPRDKPGTQRLTLALNHLASETRKMNDEHVPPGVPKLTLWVRIKRWWMGAGSM
jgi:hypothetical protein